VVGAAGVTRALGLVALGSYGENEDQAMQDWRDRIEINPDVMLAKPVIAGTRIPGQHILRKLPARMNIEHILRDHPRLCREDIQAALAYDGDPLDTSRLLPNRCANSE
jgi:uncharacterized protein (DUF433 family)